MMMKKLIVTTLFIIVTISAMAQETHYHRSLRSQDTAYGLTQEPHFDGSGMYWSRVRNADDVAINSETAEEIELRRKEFLRLYYLAYDAFEHHDDQHTIIFGDSALKTRYHTADLYFYMALSFEKTGDYDKADWSYRHALGAGYPNALNIYKGFKSRQEQRNIEEKQKKKEEKQRKKEEKLRGK